MAGLILVSCELHSYRKITFFLTQLRRSLLTVPMFTSQASFVTSYNSLFMYFQARVANIAFHT